MSAFASNKDYNFTLAGKKELKSDGFALGTKKNKSIKSKLKSWSVTPPVQEKKQRWYREKYNAYMREYMKNRRANGNQVP